MFKVPKDKVLHVLLGILYIMIVLVGYWIYSLWGLGPMLAYSSTSYGILYEINQWVRKEGVPDPWDALATSLPGWFCWIVL